MKKKEGAGCDDASNILLILALSVYLLNLILTLMVRSGVLPK